MDVGIGTGARRGAAPGGALCAGGVSHESALPETLQGG